MKHSLQNRGWARFGPRAIVGQPILYQQLFKSPSRLLSSTWPSLYLNFKLYESERRQETEFHSDGLTKETLMKQLLSAGKGSQQGCIGAQRLIKVGYCHHPGEEVVLVKPCAGGHRGEGDPREEV